MKRLLRSSLVLLMAASACASSPTPDEPFNQQMACYRERQEGLPSTDVKDVYESWSRITVATAAGLAMWDGQKWTPLMAESSAPAGPAVPDHVERLLNTKERPEGFDIRQACVKMSDHQLLSAIAAKEGLYERKGVGEWRRITVSDGQGRRWADTDVRGVAYDKVGRLWFATRAGVGVRNGDQWRFYDHNSGLPYNDFTCAVAAPDGSIWFGTKRGAIHFDGHHWAYRQGSRWLPDDDVRAIVVDSDNTAWFATAAGVGCITTVGRTLAQKAAFYEDEIERRIKRTPYGFVAESALEAPGDKETARPLDSDNDGLWTSMYGAAQCFAYAKDHSPESKRRAQQAFEALQFLQNVCQGGEHSPDDGYVARTVLPSEAPDPNQGRLDSDRLQRETDDQLWKVYEPRWPLSADGQWWWKSDTSSDELDGHYFFHALYFDHVAETEAERRAVQDVVRRLTDHLIAHDFTLTDHDGSPTRWAVFGPDALNHDPRWVAERGLNSLSLLSYLAVAGHVTGDGKYRRIAKELIVKHSYDANAMTPKWQRGVGSGNQSDDEMAFMNFYNLIRYTEDSDLRARYLSAFYSYWVLEEPERNPFFNFAYAAVASDAKLATAFGVADLEPRGGWLEQSVESLRRMPLDRVEWRHTNSHRLDIRPLPKAATEDPFDPLGAQDGVRGGRVDGSPVPVDERSFNHWNHDPWRLDSGGDGRVLGSGAVFLLPYQMGRFHSFIE